METEIGMTGEVADNCQKDESVWLPTFSLEERLKHALTPPRLYMIYRVRKELLKGEKELRMLPFLVDKARLAVDVGANKGVWSDVLRRLCPQVHAFEPNPKIFSLLKAGAAANVTPHQIALSNDTGSAEFRVPRSSDGGYSNQGGSLSVAKVSENYGSVIVHARKFDDMSIGAVGFIKIDVEGFELQVLEGAEKTIRRDRPVMIVEIEEKHMKRPLEEAISTVESYGYAAFALLDNVLTPFGRIDMDRHHRHPARHADYINNFIFLPA